MDCAALKTEVAKYPPDMDDAAIAAAINAATVTVVMPIQPDAAIRVLMLRDRWAEIVRVSRFGDASADKVRAAIRLVEALTRLPSFNLSVPEYAAAIDGGLSAAVAVGLLDDEDKAGILRLADEERPLMGETVAPSQVAEVRKPSYYDASADPLASTADGDARARAALEAQGVTP